MLERSKSVAEGSAYTLRRSLVVETDMVNGFPVLTSESKYACYGAVCPVCGHQGMLIIHGCGWDIDVLLCPLKGCEGSMEVKVTCDDCNGKGCSECDDGLINVSTY